MLTINAKKGCIVLLIVLTVVVVVILRIFLMTLDAQQEERKQQQQTEQRQSEILSIAISNAASLNKNRAESIIDLSKITTFSWDTLYIFPPYTPSDTLDRTLGEKWLGPTNIEDSDGIVLLVFTDNGKVVQYLEYPRSPYDFAFAKKKRYSRQEAVFTIDSEGRMIDYHK